MQIFVTAFKSDDQTEQTKFYREKGIVIMQIFVTAFKSDDQTEQTKFYREKVIVIPV